MNADNMRLKEIQNSKAFYRLKIAGAETELEQDLLQVQLNRLNQEETEILQRCDAI